MDLVFVDPPYNMALSQVRNDLEAIVTQGWLADDGRIVVHRMVKEAQLKPFGLQLNWEREYGQSRILVFSHEEEEG
jgi:16S rRNA G966 N2-methylase RsmD